MRDFVEKLIAGLSDAIKSAIDIAVDSGQLTEEPSELSSKSGQLLRQGNQTVSAMGYRLYS